MARLTSEHKRFAYQQIAWDRTPTEVADIVNETFGLDTTRQQIHGLTRSKQAQREIEKLRKKAQKNVEATPSFHLAIRIKTLHDMAVKARSMRNYKLAAELLEQIAKDAGGAFTNRREHTGKDGKPLVPAKIEIELVDPPERHQ